MPEPIPPEHLSTLAYLWHQYEAQPLDPWQAWRDALLNRADRLEADYQAGAHRFGGGQAFTFLDRRLAEAAPHKR
jgi:hypothetical protein